MANVHYFLPPNSLSFPPLVRRLAQFIAKDLKVNYSVSEANDFLRYGESYSYERKKEEELAGCMELAMAKRRDVLM
jgi:predicted transglutaminase-like cysteine proteinase